LIPCSGWFFEERKRTFSFGFLAKNKTRLEQIFLSIPTFLSFKYVDNAKQKDPDAALVVVTQLILRPLASTGFFVTNAIFRHLGSGRLL
jgi:hypothetical protein